MKKKVLRVLALLLCVSMLAGLSGCVSSLSAASAGRSIHRWSASVSKELQIFGERLAALFQSDTAEAQIPGSGQYRVLLVGSDRRDGSWNGNSDAMLLLSVNYDTKKISVVSLMRDMEVTYPNGGSGKLNGAFASGGGSYLMQTIEQNFQISIDNYIAVDFWGMEHIVDLLGGVDLDITEPEISVMNEYIKELAEIPGRNPEEFYITQTGMQHLSGIQTVGYMRDRYIGNGDFERTARQRRVLEQLAQKLGAMSLTELISFAESAYGEVWTDIGAEALPDIAAVAVHSGEFTLQMDRIPYDGTYTMGNENIIPDLGQIIPRLQDYLNQ